MRKLVMIGAAFAALLAPGAPGAQVTLAARVGYAHGLGDVGGALDMGDWVRAGVPVQLDVLYRLTPRVGLGAYVSYGFARAAGDLSRACDLPGADCSASIVRVGVLATYRFAAIGRWRPWAGAGLGYEWNRVESATPSEDPRPGDRPDVHADLTFSGFEYLSLQGGAELAVTGRFSVGPYVMFSLGQYDSADASGGAALDGAIPDKKMHEWLGFGVRGRFDL